MKGYGHTSAPAKGKPAPAKGGGDRSMPEKPVGYPDVPGPTQPRDRSLGVPKLKICPEKKGL